MPLLANWMRLSRAVVYRTVSQNLILPRALSNDYGPADYKSAIQHSAAKPQPIARCGMEFSVYATIAHNLGNVAKSRVNAELHAHACQSKAL